MNKMAIQLRTYMLWKDGEYQGNLTPLGLRHEIGLGSEIPLVDMGRKGIYTWRRVYNPENMINLGEQNGKTKEG